VPLLVAAVLLCAIIGHCAAVRQEQVEGSCALCVTAAALLLQCGWLWSCRALQMAAVLLSTFSSAFSGLQLAAGRRRLDL